MTIRLRPHNYLHTYIKHGKKIQQQQVKNTAKDSLQMSQRTVEKPKLKIHQMFRKKFVSGKSLFLVCCCNFCCSTKPKSNTKTMWKGIYPASSSAATNPLRQHGKSKDRPSEQVNGWRGYTGGSQTCGKAICLGDTQNLRNVAKVKTKTTITNSSKPTNQQISSWPTTIKTIMRTTQSCDLGVSYFDCIRNSSTPQVTKDFILGPK